MRCPPSISVDDDFSTCDAGVALRSANDEAACGIDMVYCMLVNEMGWDDLLYDVGEDLLAEGGCEDYFGVLG